MALATKPLVEIVMPSFTMAAASAAVITGFFCHRYRSFFKRLLGLKVSQRGLSLLKESSHPLLFVVGCKGQTKIGSLHIEATVQISIYASLNAHLGEGDGVAALGQHFVSHHEAEIEQLRLRNHLVYKADAIGLLCVEFYRR